MNGAKSPEAVREAVTKFIREELSYGLGDDLDPNADLIEQGIIDSMSLLRLVSFIEEMFAIEVRDEDLVPQNFRSLAAIETFAKRSSGGGK